MVAADEIKCEQCGEKFWAGYKEIGWDNLFKLPQDEWYKHKKCEKCRPKEECENTENNSPVV